MDAAASMPPSATTDSQQLIERIPLYIPSADPVKEDTNQKLTLAIQSAYNHCVANPMPLLGDHFLTFDIDLSKRGVEILDSKGERKKVGNMKMSSYTFNGQCISLKWVFDFNNKHETYITPRGTDSLKATLFDGMEYERIFAENVFPMPPKAFWDNWEKLIPQEVNHYETVIYPKIIETVKKISVLTANQQMDVLDLGGGSGRLAAAVLDNLQGRVKKVTVIDSSSALLEQARIKAKKYPDQLAVKKIDLNDTNPLSAPGFRSSADLIILCGVVAQQVLEKGVAKKVIEACLPILRDNGFIIAASLSPGLLNSKEYEEMGFRVFNKSFTFYKDRGPTQLPYSTNEFYILQKK